MKFLPIFVVVCGSFFVSIDALSIGTSSSGEISEAEMMMIASLGLSPQDVKDFVLKFAQEECRNVTGTDEAYDKLVKSKMTTALNCVENALSMNEMYEELEKATQTDNYQKLFEKSCQVVNHVVPCLENFINSFEPCMDDEEKEIVRISLIIVRALIDFGCSRTVDELVAILDVKEDECLMSKKEAVENCSDDLSSFIGEDRNATETRILQLLTEEKGCTELVDFETCTLPLFDECQNKKPVELFSGLLKSIIDQTPCKDRKIGIKSNAIENNDV